MKTYRTSISIHAEPAAIWAILTDAERYPEWNNTVERVEGTPQGGPLSPLLANLYFRRFMLAWYQHGYAKRF